MEKYRELSIIPQLNLDNEEQFNDMITLCNALGNNKRLMILKEINNPPYAFSVSYLTEKLKMPTSTLMHHLQILTEACLINYRYHNTSNGAIRIYTRNLRGANLQFYLPNEEKKNQPLKCEIQSLGVGNYANYEGESFSFATKTKLYDMLGDKCFSPYRFEAELIYSTSGIIEYYFDNMITKTNKVEKMVLFIEICSEAPYYDNNYKSEITFWINGKEIGTYISQGDYGDRRGKLNPKWWSDHNTQYGKIVTISIDDCVYIDGVLINNKIKIDDLNLEKENKISIKFGNKKTATYPGGFNIFGKNFGDYSQDIILKLYYK